MTQMLNQTPKSWRIISIIYCLFLSAIMLMAYLGVISTRITGYPHLDKVAHFILVGFAAFLLHKLFNRKKIINNKIPLGPLLVLLFFAIDEYAQKFSPTRSCTMYDFIANASGVFFFMFIEKRWPDIGPTWAIEKMQRGCAFLYWQLGKLKEKQTL